MADIRKELNQIKHAVYGREVRGSIHDGIDKVNRESEGSRQIAEETEQRQDAVEEQFNTLLEEWSDDRPIDNAETIAARTNTKESKTYENLGKRLDEEYGKVTAQLAETDDQSFLNRPVSRFAERPPMITIHDDDGDVGFYTKLYPLAKEYNIPIVSALVTGYRRGFPGDDRTPNPANCNYEQIMEMHASGLVEFVSHTHNHILHLTEESRETIRYELKESRDFLKRYGFNHRVVVFPGGHINEKVLEETRQIYEYSTTYGGANIVGTPGFSNYKIPRVSMQRPFSEIKPQIDEAIENNAWIILRLHVDQWAGYTEAHMREIIEYALGKGMKFVTTEEGIRHHSNILEVNDKELIASDGSFHGKRLGRVIVDSDIPVTAETSMREFEPNTVTYHRITNNNASGFPSSKGTNSGILKTTRLHKSESFWNFQEFYPNSEDVSYKRHWVESKTFDPFDEVETPPGWTDWKLQTASHYKPVNSYNANTTMEDYNVGITLEHINSSGYSDDLPSNTGTLTTYRLDTNTTGFNYQEFVRFHHNEKYVRHATPTGWSEWVRQTDYRHVPINTFDGTNSPDDFKTGTTHCYVSGRPNDLPTGSSGNLVTVKEAGIGRSYQEFRPGSSKGKFLRTENSSGEWSKWQRFLVEDI